VARITMVVMEAVVVTVTSTTAVAVSFTFINYCSLYNKHVQVMNPLPHDRCRNLMNIFILLCAWDGNLCIYIHVINSTIFRSKRRRSGKDREANESRKTTRGIGMALINNKWLYLINCSLVVIKY
jgi:hypothetical protein